MKQVTLLFFILFSTLTTASNVVFVHSYHSAYPWVQQYRSGFLKQINKVNIYEYELDTKRRPESEFTSIAIHAWHFIEQKKPDLVVLADDNALKLLGHQISKNNIPLVFLGINANPRVYLTLNKYISGAIERPLMKRSVSMLRKLLPELKHINVMMDNRATSHAILETSFSNKLEQTISGITVSSSLISDYDTWKQRVINAKKRHYDAIIIANYAALKDELGNNVPLDEVSRWTSENSPVPVFSFWSYSIGVGKAIGGLTISGEQQGQEAAKIVNGYFNSGELRPIVTPARGRFIFSEHELQRWGIALPPYILDKALLLP